MLKKVKKNFVKKLFEREVSEIHDGIVEIKGIAREAGNRTKIAVASNDPRVDPVGSCVGMRGTRVKNITNELKTLAKTLDIPTITAQQLNRVAASVVDAAIQAKKEDVTKLVGRDGIAGAWEIIENSDFVCILIQEIKADTEELFMTFKMLKRRYRSSEESEKMRRLDYFNHPYEPENSICLIDDVNLPKSLSLYSLSTEFKAVGDTQKRGKKNAVERPNTKDGHNRDDWELSLEPFDPDNSTYF